VSSLLVVEDHPPLATVVAIGLRRSGHAVLRVGSVERARASDHNFDCAVIDFDLPDGSGVELARELLDSGQTRAVVFYTASRDSALKTEARTLGPVVDKMGNLDELLRVVAEELESLAADAKDERARAVGDAALSVGRQSGRSGLRRRVRRDVR
jgi:DNA-binding response OmpR family regulator